MKIYFPLNDLVVHKASRNEHVFGLVGSSTETAKQPCKYWFKSGHESCWIETGLVA